MTIPACLQHCAMPYAQFLGRWTVRVSEAPHRLGDDPPIQLTGLSVPVRLR